MNHATRYTRTWSIVDQTLHQITWCFSDRASWNGYILITNLMHWLLFIHKILFSSTCFEPQVLIFRRIQLYTCSIWYCHSLWEFLVACRYTAWVRTDWGGRLLVGRKCHMYVKNLSCIWENTVFSIINWSFLSSWETYILIKKSR